jgi:hypothetical protein
MHENMEIVDSYFAVPTQQLPKGSKISNKKRNPNNGENIAMFHAHKSLPFVSVAAHVKKKKGKSTRRRIKVSDAENFYDKAK